MIILIIIGIVIVAIEIIVDRYLWKTGKSDKIKTTIGRAALILLAAWIMPFDFWMNCAVIAATFFLIFDFALNVSRWGDLPIPFYRPYHSVERELKYKQGYSALSAAALAYDKLLTKQKIIYKTSKFTKRFFWHGDEETKNWYDLAFQRIPALAELIIIKSTIFGIAIYFY